MTPILQNLTGLIFLFAAETGIVLANFNRNTGREFNKLYDHSVGYETGFAAFNPIANYSWNGKISGSSGMAIAAPGIAVTTANLATGNGVTAGTIFTESVSISHAEKGFREVSINAFQQPGIVAA